MISCKELRIGNTCIVDGKIDTVNLIDEETAGFTKAGCWYYEKDMMPIPLTPDILERLGFGFSDEYDTLVYADTAICCHYDGVEWCFKYGLDSDLTIAACEYVHQVQNLIFCLTNKELTFNNQP